MAPKPRSKRNRGHPKGWRWKNGAWRYRVPAGLEHQWDGKREFTLGRDETEAYRVWSNRLQLQQHARTIGDLLDRYGVQVVPDKAPKTQRDNLASLTRLRAVFGHMQIDHIRPKDVYAYFDARGATPTSAHRDVEILSHAYTKAIEWGLTESHPIRHKVRLPGEKPRERYVTDEELMAALTVANPVVRAYIGVKVLTGLRRGDILRLRTADLHDDGVHVVPNKTRHTTGKRLIIEWTAELREAFDAALAARPKDIAPTVFCTRRGEPYMRADGSANAFDSMWQRFMAKVLAQTDVSERFQERDLRAKTASDMAPELATALLGHADPRITQRVYRRRPEIVQPGAAPKLSHSRKPK